MVISLESAKLVHVAPLPAGAYRSKGPHGPATTSPKVLALIVAAPGGGVMDAGLSLNRDASDAIARVRIIHVWKMVLMLDELRMVSVVAVMLIGNMDENLKLLQKE